VTFVRETSLRPSTVFGLRAPHDYEPGARLLRIRGENDKARFARDLPITDRARAAIDARFPTDGIIFPEFDCRDALREAALVAGMTAHRASKLSIYDFRHGRGTEWGRTGNLIGIAYLMGHKHVTTTKEYLHSNLEEAEAVLFPTSYLTSPADAAPTTAELIAQAAEMTGCGREDSNLHEYYLTRSLGDQAPPQSLNLLWKAASAEVAEGHETSNTGRVVPKERGAATMAEVREAAQNLVHRVAEGGELPIEALRDFAALTLRCELVHLAQRLLDAPPEFAVRRAMELAGLVLTLGENRRAEEDSSQADVTSDAVGIADAAEGEGSK